MSVRRCSRTAVFLALSLAGAPSLSAKQAAEEPAIQVTVNGENVPFPGQGPVKRGAAVLVPLRGVFEKLGASVEFDSAARAITATRGATVIVLRLGEVNATVNGSPRTLSSPPEVLGGATLVPLRFVSEALGAQVKWNSEDRLVAITTDAVVAANLPTIALEEQRVIGSLTGVFPESKTLTVRTRDGENKRISFANRMVVQARSLEGKTETVSLNALRNGDQVIIRRDSAGNASVVEKLVNLRRGYVKEMTLLPGGNTRVLLTNGAAVEVRAGAPVRMSTADISLTDIKIGEQVVIRIDPASGLGVSVALVTASDRNPTPPDPDTAPAPDVAPPQAGVSEVSSAALTQSSAANPIPSSSERGTPSEPATPMLPQVNDREPVPGGGPEIRSVSHDAGDRLLKGGDKVTVTVNGTPNGEVTVTVPVLFEGVPLPLKEREDAPGTYVGEFSVPYNVTALDVPLRAVMKRGDAVTEPRQAEQMLRADSAGPEVTGIQPKENATVMVPRPAILGGYSDRGSKVDPKQARLYVNDKEVTAQAQFSESAFTYTPGADLPPGPVRVAVVVADIQGNESRKEWSFVLQPPVRPIRKVTIAPTGVPLRANDIFTVRMEGAPGGNASFRIETMEEQPMREEAPGIYVGTYRVQRGDMVRKAKVIVSIILPGSEDKVLRESEESVTLLAAPPSAPVLDSPKEGDTVGKQFVVSGTSEPYATIRIAIKFEGRKFLSKATGTLPTVEVKAGDDGRFKTEPIPIEVIGLTNLTFTIEVVAVTVGSEVSPPTIVRFKKK